MAPNPPPYHPGPLSQRPQGAYRAALISVAVIGALLFLMLVCTAATNPREVPGCIGTLAVLGLPAAGLIWWLRQRQQQQEVAQAYTLWVAEQERQQQLEYAEQERQRQDAWLAGYEVWRAEKVWRAEQERQQRLMHLKTLGDLLVKTPAEFEYAIADLLPSLGYVDVQHTGKPGDRGADIQCLSPDGETVIVQCKQYGTGKKVSSPAVQAFMGACLHYDARWGLFITTSTFTEDARELAEEHNWLSLIDGETLTGLIQSAQQRHGQQTG